MSGRTEDYRYDHYKGRRLNKRGRRKKRARGCLRTVASMLVIVISFICVKNIVFDNLLNPDSSFSIDTGALAEMFGGDGSTESQLKRMARSNDTVRQILEQPDLYPEELLEMLAGNEEAAQFVLDYPENKDNTPADSIGDVTKGEIPLLLQWDERWGYGAYGNSMIAISGCGPTVVAMVSAGLLGDSSITPYKVAQYAQDHGYYVEGTGTSWSLMTEGARQFGVQGQELGLSESSIVSELENGHPIICSMRPGDFTTSGHFIVLTGVENGKIRVNDPNSKVNSEKLWDYDRLESQINNLWAFSVA